MPIQDWDGSASHEIGKVYDYDGTTIHPIGKVHDYDGTTSSLIYSAESWLLKEGVGGESFSNIVTNAGCSSSCDFTVHDYSQVSYKTLNIYCTANNYQYANNAYSNKILYDLTNYKYLSAKWSNTNGTGTMEFWIGVTDNLTNDGTDSRWFNFRDASLAYNYYSHAAANFSGEVLLDISQITGSHYLWIGTATSYNTWLNVYFTELHLS